MEPTITLNVQSYRLLLPNGQSPFVLQAPLQHDEHPSGSILVRQYQGTNNNEVTFKRREDLVKTDDAPYSTHAHGYLLFSDSAEQYHKGDLVWLREVGWKPGSNRDPSKVHVVNLRTRDSLTLPLDAVCWMPKYRKIDRADGEEELLTISGSPKRNLNDRKLYVLAIKQRLLHNGPNPSSARLLHLEIQELVEQELFFYQNLSISPDGKKTAERLFRWAMAGREVQPAASELMHTPRGSFSGPLVVTPSTSITLSVGYVSNVGEEEDEDPDFDRDARQLWKKGMGNLNRPRSMTDTHICNLPEHECPTPPRVFFLANRPTMHNPFPTHHHRLDHECPLGPAHRIHCVFPSAHVQMCIIPCTVKHQCCVTGVWPRNTSIFKPSTTIDHAGGGGGVNDAGGVSVVVVKEGNRLTLVQQPEEEYADLPIHARPMGFNAAWDNDEIGHRTYGAEDRDDVVNGEWIFAKASLEGAEGSLNQGILDLHEQHQTQHQQHQHSGPGGMEEGGGRG
ncbi:hypothetical protein BD289DRAFT_453128 [Coniella lustricola]|uniref:Uncharacterized protein n=1 Tax=Coniella lustricola TaxID=2025994 RepID=A0A2T3A8L5_9PEZI|nr:hypothetical protein BD289DRAFT_453128 [Coniella lustricola]